MAPARRDDVDVRDLADAVRRAADASTDQRVFNIGRGEAVPMGEVVGLLLASAALPEEQIRVTEVPVQSKGGDWTRADTGGEPTWFM